MNPLPCIDIGANLTHKSFRKDLDSVIRLARNCGVERMIVTGTSVRSSHEAAELILDYPDILYSTAGVHPHEAHGFDPDPNLGTIAVLERLAAKSNVVAIGECGLDFNRDFSPRAIQHECFQAQLDLASSLEMPVFLHERDAHDLFLDTIREWRERLSKGVVHCFTGSKEQLHAYLDLDLHIGITGWICDERRGSHLRSIVFDIPINRLMVETDSPFLAPRDLSKKIHRNEPKYLPHIVGTIAECRGELPEELAENTSRTASEFFGLEK